MACLPAQGIVAFDIGQWLAGQPQRLWSGDRRRGHRRAVQQPVQQVEDMGLGRNTGFKCQLDGAQHRLFIVVQHQGQDIDHFSVPAGLAQHLCLQHTEGFGSTRKGSGISTKGAPLRSAPGLR